MEYNYKFKNKKLFDLAMTHISLANDLHIESNQRLEFWVIAFSRLWLLLIFIMNIRRWTREY